MAHARIAVSVGALGVLLALALRPAQSLAQAPQEQPDAASPEGAAAGAMRDAPAGARGRIDLPTPPLITMTAVPGYGSAPLAVGFFVNTVDPEGKGFVSYVWNFGDGQVSMDPPLTFFHTYKTPGTYVATVNATTADGRTATAYAGVTVRPGLAD
ncbi:MAG TPA: PKD domain-containing protein [Candidatus Binataceae bacterium]|nr:PKD domain-containing protein [Candidatus Binataceae bacterium]